MTDQNDQGSGLTIPGATTAPVLDQMAKAYGGAAADPGVDPQAETEETSLDPNDPRVQQLDPVIQGKVAAFIQHLQEVAEGYGVTAEVYIKVIVKP